MDKETIAMQKTKNVAHVAHDNKRQDFTFSSRPMSEEYEREIPDEHAYKNRDVPVDE